MKFSKLRQLLLVSAIGLVVATLFSGCQLVTIDYLFVTTAGSKIGSNGSACAAGEIETFAVDSESGAIRTAASPVCSGGTTPVALAISPGYQNLYTANQVDMNVVHFSVGDNGVLTKKDTLALATAPASLAVSPDGNTLYAVSGTTSATLSAVTLSSGALGSISNQVSLTLPGANAADEIVPTGVTVLANGDAVYVTAYDLSSYNPGGTTTSTAVPGWVFGFAIGSGGALTPTPGSPYQAGVKPSALVADPTNRFVYVTDFASNQIIGFGIYTGSQLSFLQNGPYKSGGEPSSIAVDPRGKFLYVSNALDSSVTAYVIDLASGTPSAAINTTGSQLNSTDTQPVAVAVDPALGRFVYTANYLGNSVSGFSLNPISGTLKQTQATPYPLNADKPTAVVMVPHGNHSTQTVTP
jgi:6-phosphogluconolactonase